MAKSNDFGSSSRSPGGWGGTGGGTATGGMGGSKSSSRYEYRTGASPTGPAIGNWNTGGATAGFGNQYGVSENKLGRNPYPGTAGPTNRFIQQVPIDPIPPPVAPPAVDPVVAALVRRPVGILGGGGVFGVAPGGMGAAPPQAQGAPQGVPATGSGYSPEGNNPFTGARANPGVYGPRTQNAAGMSVRSAGYANNPKYGF